VKGLDDSGVSESESWSLEALLTSLKAENFRDLAFRYFSKMLTWVVDEEKSDWREV
jgi:hypothetical protein